MRVRNRYMETETKMEDMLKERFDKLPKVVQDAILSAHVTEHLRSLANNNKLHLDQWEKLEHEVQMTLMGFKEADELGSHIHDELGIPLDAANTLAQEIGHTVFEPIRQQLERELEHPEAQAEEVSVMEKTRAAAMEGASTGASTPGVSAPATPPAPAQTGTAVRSSEALYISNTPSHERKSIDGDPYREQVG